MIKKTRKKKEPKTYFTKDTENAILEYLTITDQNQRDKLYKDRIEYGFFKLTQNIIHTYKYYYTDGESIEDLQQEVIYFLLLQLHKYKPEKGAAYSYFGTIAKRYLINKNKKNYKKLQEKTEVSEIDDDHQTYTDLINESNKIDLSKFLDLYIQYVYKHINEIFPKSIDHPIVFAMLHLFKTRNTLEIFNKKAIYIYIREMTGVNTSQITKIIKQLKVIYKKLFNQYYENDYIII